MAPKMWKFVWSFRMLYGNNYRNWGTTYLLSCMYGLKMAAICSRNI